MLHKIKNNCVFAYIPCLKARGFTLRNRKLWEKQDLQFLVENYPDLGAEYCAERLDRKKEAVIIKARRIGLKSKRIKKRYHKENLSKIIKESINISQVLVKLGLKRTGGNPRTINKYIKLYGIDTSHFVTRAELVKKMVQNFVKIPLDIILIKDSRYASTSNLKDRLYKDGIKERVCEKCGIGEIWHGKRMSLILDHINGVRNDNRLENLMIVCPNCNATLETHCRGHKYLEDKKKKEILKTQNKIIIKQKYKDAHLRNRKVNRPDYETLLHNVKEMGYCSTGRLYGVSDNSIRKWIKNYEKNGY